ncbi:hypothetical protein KIL84_008777, partial [Mauremys mutica]
MQTDTLPLRSVSQVGSIEDAVPQHGLGWRHIALEVCLEVLDAEQQPHPQIPVLGLRVPGKLTDNNQTFCSPVH